MSKTILRRTIAIETTLVLLVLTSFLAGGCSDLARKDSACDKREVWSLLPEILSRIVPPTFPDRDFVVTDYGAVGDGATDCNPAFKKAIAACTKAGGGRVAGFCYCASAEPAAPGCSGRAMEPVDADGLGRPQTE